MPSDCPLGSAGDLVSMLARPEYGTSARAKSSRLHQTCTTPGYPVVADVRAALETQTVIVPGTTIAEIVLPKLADSPKTILQQRKSISENVERSSPATRFLWS